MHKWKIKSQVDHYALEVFLDCTARISKEISDIVAGQGTNVENEVTVPNAIRNISTGLRNIYLDGNGSLIKRCLEDPNMHPFRYPDQEAYSIEATQRIPKYEADIVLVDGSKHHIVMPEHDMKTVAHPLFGVSYKKDYTVRLTNPFELSAQPIKFNKWMNKKVVMVDNCVFTSQDLLRIMANQEGAHRNELTPFVSPIRLTVDKHEKFLAISKVRFGFYSYLEVFSLFTGWYTVERTKLILSDLPWSRSNGKIEGLRNVIRKCPSDKVIKVPNVKNIASPFIALGHDMEVQGDYREGVVTTIRIP
ncbi:MAG: hypothetical protein OXH02_12500 [Gemmatimonadetes bacterium]|nr:hypothetical protein [Gemmatimonadota bacterium]